MVNAPIDLAPDCYPKTKKKFEITATPPGIVDGHNLWIADDAKIGDKFTVTIKVKGSTFYKPMVVNYTVVGCKNGDLGIARV